MMNGLRMPPFGQRSGTCSLESRMLVGFQFQVIWSMIQADIRSRDLAGRNPPGFGMIRCAGPGDHGELSGGGFLGRAV
jgi:hypothetical protein